MTARVTVVGDKPDTRQMVADALGAPVASIQWVEALDAAEKSLENGRDDLGIVVLTAEVSDADAANFAEAVACVSPATPVLLLRQRGGGTALPLLIRAGIRDVVDLRQGEDELRDSLERAYSWSENLRSVAGEDRGALRGVRGTVICTFSSKGGTGKSFLACNLATAIAKRTGDDTALVDLDIAIGDVFSYFGREATRPIQDLIALGNKVDRRAIEASATVFGENLWGFGAPADPAASEVPPEAVGKVLRALSNHYAYTVVDSPAGYAESVLSAVDMADQVCMVAGLDVVGIKHLAQAVSTLESIDVPKSKMTIVLNRADSQVGLDPADVERLIGYPIDAMIPSSRLVPTSLNKGEPVYLDEPGSAVSKSLDELVEHLLPAGSLKEAVGAGEAKPSLLKRFFNTDLGGVTDVAS